MLPLYSARSPESLHLYNKIEAMNYFDAPYLSINWDDDCNCVCMEWKKFVKGRGYRDGLDKGLELAVSKSTARWLADLRMMNVVDIDDQAWSNEDWFPRAMAGGIMYMAIVVPEDEFAKMSVNSIMGKVPESAIQVAYFEENGEAKQWLKKQPGQ